MLKPLEQFVCDRCGQLIEKPQDGYFEWLSDHGGEKNRDFKIVHHAPRSPFRTDGKHGDCYHHTGKYASSDLDLPRFLGPEGIVKLLSMLDVGEYHDPENRHAWDVADNREFVEIFRRLHVPYYEEARLYWDKARADGFFDGANEIWLYLPSTLKTLIERYGDEK